MMYMQGMATDTLEKTLEEQFLQFLLEQGKKVACKYSYRQRKSPKLSLYGSVYVCQLLGARVLGIYWGGIILYMCDCRASFLCVHYMLIRSKVSVILHILRVGLVSFCMHIQYFE